MSDDDGRQHHVLALLYNPYSHNYLFIYLWVFGGVCALLATGLSAKNTHSHHNAGRLQTGSGTIFAGKITERILALTCLGIFFGSTSFIGILVPDFIPFFQFMQQGFLGVAFLQFFHMIVDMLDEASHNENGK
ncbi:hypothetical protein CYMTET_11597, partial [Cymbomonas tetramitiformis]